MINLLDELLAVCGALVGGAKYGLKIRLPHALVMVRIKPYTWLVEKRDADPFIVFITFFLDYAISKGYGQCHILG